MSVAGGTISTMTNLADGVHEHRENEAAMWTQQESWNRQFATWMTTVHDGTVTWTDAEQSAQKAGFTAGLNGSASGYRDAPNCERDPSDALASVRMYVAWCMGFDAGRQLREQRQSHHQACPQAACTSDAD